ncbi:MAG: hypothetical protein K0Q68_316 [Moraxellaceae bacterium]|jgi:hypothetical protein|nr:hypothetical protein [Moraxellaceae bacterium]
MAGLSKSRLIAHLQCPKRLWLQMNKPELTVVDASQQSRMDAGNVVGDIARQLHPGGILIDGGSLSQALKDTEALLAKPKRVPVFEATFNADSVLVRNDLLLPERGGYHLAEVKSSTSVKSYHLQDVAIQAHVAEACGVKVKRISVVHINNQFVYPGNEDYQGLFTTVDVTSQARDLQPEVPGWIKAAQKTLKGKEPRVETGAQCTDPYECPFIGYCHPAADPEAYPVEELPRIGKQADALRAEGYDDIRELPRDRLRNDSHLLVWDSLQKGKPVLRKEVAAAMSTLAWPRYYMDFETISFAAPIWAGTRPYQQVPFQWSCHVESHTGTLRERGWLAEGLEDPRREFVETLLAAIGPRGSVLVWNASFERSRLQEMAVAFPEHAEALQSIINRMVDLLVIARDHYYHPDMRGSWSIKAVLPTVAPELDYSELEVGDGGMAQEAFLELLSPETDPARALQVRAALVEYCGRDTQAMVELAKFFEGRRKASRRSPARSPSPA